MTRKCLIALTLIAVCSGPVLADPTWGVTTAMMWDWAEKSTTVDVYIKVVRWAELWVKWAVVLKQQNTNTSKYVSGDFYGGTWIEVCNNFSDLHIEADIAPISPVDGTGAPTGEKNPVSTWFLSLTEYASMDGAAQPDPANMPDPAGMNAWGDPDGTASVVVDVDKTAGAGLNLTGNHGWVWLGVLATGVDPQGMMFDPAGFDGTTNDNVRRVGLITLTYYPNLAPTSADVDFGSVSPGTDAAGNLGAGAWDENGHIPNGHPTLNNPL